jgi:hypothetical protein
MKIKIFYDDNLKTYHGNETVSYIRDVMAQAQNIYMNDSLTTKIIFQIDENVEHIPEKWTAAESL